MHEMSYVVRMVNLALDQARAHQAVKVQKLRIQVGAMTGLEPEYLRRYYPEAVKNTLLAGSSLEIEWIPVAAACSQCGCEFEPCADNHYNCPSCGSSAARILRGREFLLSDMTIETDDQDLSVRQATDEDREISE